MVMIDENRLQTDLSSKSSINNAAEDLNININEIAKNHSNSFSSKLPIPKEKILRILEAGIQAPSADNMQLWQFKIQPNGFELWINKDVGSHFFDFNNIATNISCGALIENIVIMAEAEGLEVSVLYSKDIPLKIANIQFLPMKKKRNNAYYWFENNIFTRSTNRNIFNFSKKISDKIINKLAEDFSNDSAYKFYVYSDKQKRKQMIRILASIDIIRYAHKKMHIDLHEIFRFGKDAELKRDGLADKTLGVESFFFPILKILKSWKITKFLNYCGLNYIMSFRSSYIPLISSSHIISIVHKGPYDSIEFGRIMQRFWLHATNEGLSVQPYGALPLLFTRLNESNDPGFNRNQILTLQTLQNKFAKITDGFDIKQDQVVMVFRLGYSNKKNVKSLRKHLSSFIQ